MQGPKRVRVWAALCLAGFLLSGTTWGQRTTGSLGGVVQDQTGAVIPGAGVEVINQQTGVVRRAVTAEAGTFIVTNLPPGNYTVRIAMPGFKTYERTGVRVQSASDIREVFEMEVGEVSETITVQGGATLISTVSSEQRVGLAEEQLRKLPVSRRNVTQLLILNPAVTTSGGHRGVRMNGMGRQSARYSVDGVEASGSPGGNLIGQYGGRNQIDVMSLDGIQDVQILKGVLPAEYGLSMSGQVNVISKSGTNEFHGSLFHLYQTHGLNAQNPFLKALGRPKGKLVYNQFGGSIGGPMLPRGGAGPFEGAYFFFAFEGYEQRRDSDERGDVPTQKARDLALASPNFDDRERQILQALFAPLPFPNVPGTEDALGLSGQFRTLRSAPAEDKTWTAKWDLHFEDAGHISVTWTRMDPSFSETRIVEAADRVWLDNNNRYAASYYLSRGNWTLESRFGVQRLFQDRLDKFFEVRDPTRSDEEFFAARRVPRINVRIVQDVDGAKGGFGTLPGELWTTNATTYNVDQKVGYITGNHFIKFGGSYRYKAGNRNNPELPDMNFSSFQDFLNNQPNRLSATFGRPHHNGRIFQFGGFVQDDWRVHPRLTLNLGLRYDFISNFTVSETQLTPSGVALTFLNLEPPTDWPSFNWGAPLERGLAHDKLNLAPRFGFNYDLTGQRKFVLQGGFGVMYTNHILNTVRDAVQSLFLPRRQIFSGQQMRELGIRLGTMNAQARQAVEQVQTATGTFRPIPFSTYDPFFDAPYAYHYTLGIETEFMRDYVLEVDYVGNRGVKFPLPRRPNEPDRLTGVKPNPLLGGLANYYDNSNQTVYNGLQTRLQKRFTETIGFGFSYAWGKSIAIGSADVGARFGSDVEGDCCQDFFDFTQDRGVSNGNVDHFFTTNWYWQLPGPSNGFARQILGGWNFSGLVVARTGGPIEVEQRDGPRVTQRPDLAPGFTHEDSRFPDFGTTLQFFNPAAFVEVPFSEAGVPIRPGNLGVNFIDGPGAWTLDVSLGKSFFIGESRRVTFRWDFFNALNHFNPGGPRSNFSGSRFGRIEGLGTGMRVSQLNLRFEF